MIKVLHCVSVMDRAGQETFIMNVFRKIDKSEFMFNFLCTSQKKGDYDDEIYALGGEIFYLPENKYNHGIKNWINEIKILTEWFIENKDKYDIVHLHTCHALSVLIYAEACRRAGVKKMIAHSHSTNAPHKFLNEICVLLCNFYSFKCLACSIEAGRWLYGNHNVRRDKVKVVYNGIAVEQYRYEKEIADIYKKRLGAENKIVIGHVGRFHDVKNHEKLINVFYEFRKQHEEAMLLLIGTGELENHIKEKVARLGISDSVCFLGGRSDVANLMMAMDALVFPSKYEGLSIVLVEAQASGLYSIVTDSIVPEEEEIIPEVFNRVSLLENDIYWAKQLCTVKEKNIDRKKCNIEMLNSGFNINKTVKMLEEIYKDIL